MLVDGQCFCQAGVRFRRGSLILGDRLVAFLTHFGEFNVGHAHSAVFGAFSIWIFAGVYFVVPKVFGKQIWSSKLAGWHYWLEIMGFGLMFSALTIAGLVQGQMLLTAGPLWIDTVNEIKPYWLARTLGGTAMDVGLALFVLNIVMSFVIGKDADEESPTGSDPEMMAIARSVEPEAPAPEASAGDDAPSTDGE